MNVIYLGCNGFPVGLAQVERQKLIAKSLVELGMRVFVISRVGIHNPKDGQIAARGNFEGIDYIFASGSPYRQTSFLKRCLFKAIGVVGELFILFKLKLFFKIDFIILSCYLFRPLRYYFWASRILKINVVLDNVEFSSAMILPKQDKNFSLFDEMAFKYTDFAICISNFLANRMRNQKFDLPIIKIPAICDFNKIDSVEVKMGTENYFLFCGSAFYVEVIEFILKSFSMSETGDYNLYLVVNGRVSDIARMNMLIQNNHKRNKIKVFSKLDYVALITLYKQAKALLIPLRPTIQDKARFPHKIGEYTASGRPLITTNVGEVPYYFKDMDNALIAKGYDPLLFAEKMDFAIKFPQLADEIGERGKNLCKLNFDYRLYGQQIVQMVSS